MGKSQRTKGAAGEREVCHLIQDMLGVEAKRNLSQTREGAAEEFLDFDLANGKRLAGLTRRRKAEHDLFLTD